MKNVMKKIVSILTITAIAVSMLGVMPIASAEVLYTEDFSDAALPAGYEVIHKTGYECPTHGLSANMNTIMVEAEQLKFFIAGKETYKGIEGHELGIDDPNGTQLNGHSNGHMAGQLGAGHFNSTLKIPLNNLPTSGVYTISFDYYNPTGSGSVKWEDLASIYNSENKRVLRGRSFANSANVNMGGYGQLSQISWAGYSTSDKTGTTDADSYDKGIGASITKNVTKVTFTLDLDNGTASVDIGGTYADNIYFINDMTSSGYLYFNGSLAHYCTNTSKYSDATIYLDNLEIKEVVDYTKLPIDIKMDSEEEFVYSTTREGWNPPTINYAKIIAEPSNVENNVFEITVPENSTSGDGHYAWHHLVFPYKNLAEDENLKISYRYKDLSGSGKLYWEHFGTVTTTAEFKKAKEDPSVLRGLSYNYNPGFCTADYQWPYLNFAGYDNNQHTYTQLQSTDIGQKAINVRAEKTGWWTVTYLFDRENELVNITMENEDGNKIEDFVYTINELPSNGYLRFDVRNCVANTAADIKVYIDDVKMTTWKPLAVESTNITETDFDAQDDIEITFNQDVADFATVKQAITIIEADGTEVAPNRITVEGSGNVATIKVAGGLKYGKTTYTLTLDSNIIASADGLKLTKEYSKEFTTKLGKSVYVSSATDLSSNSTTVTITNPEGTEKDVWVILALYSSTNELIGFAEGELSSVAANTTTAPITLTANNVEGEVNTAKVLLWDDCESLIPYHIPVVVK